MKPTKKNPLSGRRRFLKQVAAAGLGSLALDVPGVESAILQPQSGSSRAAVAPPRPSERVRSAVATRKPTSTLRDPRNVVSAVAVDPIRNEVIMAEENNFSILVYDRMENTPPRAALSEPKRTVQGEKSYLEYSCGVYVDPATGDIYAINNDTLNWMTVFDRNAKGNVDPNRKLATPQATFAIIADEEKQEVLMTVQDSHAVIAYRKNAKDQEPPVRLLQGPKTQMADPHGLALDPKTNLIYVTNWGTHNERRVPTSPTGREAKANWPVGMGNNSIPGSGRWEPPSITVYPKDAKGDVAPLRKIQGANTLMNWPTSIAVHPDRGELYVANDTSDSITVYRADADGDVAPIRVLKGPRSMIKNPTGVALDLVNNELWVANFGNHSTTVYPIDAGGDPVPKRVIRTAPADAPAMMLSNPHTIAFDTKRQEVLVSNCVGHPQIAAFARLANGAVKPSRAIAGQHTLFNRTIHDMAYDPVRDEILVPANHAFAILTFRGDATGDASPVRKIYGPKSRLTNPSAVAIDAVHGEIFVPQSTRVLVFDRDANGEVAPIRTLEGPDTKLGGDLRITVDPVNNFMVVAGNGSIRIYDRLAAGNTKPLRVITSHGASFARIMTNNPANGMIFAAVRVGNNDDESIAWRFALDDYVGVWSVYDDGDVPARFTIGGPNLILKDARGIAIDTKNKDVIVSDKTLNAVFTFNVPEAFV